MIGRLRMDNFPSVVAARPPRITLASAWYHLMSMIAFWIPQAWPRRRRSPLTGPDSAMSIARRDVTGPTSPLGRMIAAAGDVALSETFLASDVARNRR
jgi:hypothetical protein